MAERVLITKLVRHGDRADLYARGHQYKDLTLFTLSDLAEVGIDYAKLPEGEESPCRFWATFELSDKLNKKGNPYKDVVALEPMNAPATSTSVDNSAVLAELRAIRSLLTAIAGAQGLKIPEPEPEAEPEPDELETAFPRYGDGTAPGPGEAEQTAFSRYVDATGHVPPNGGALREWIIAQARPANGNGKPAAPKTKCPNCGATGNAHAPWCKDDGHGGRTGSRPK